MGFQNENGRAVLLAMVEAVHKNRQYLGDIDGLIGDGDHGMNMNKGFVTYAERLGDRQTGFSEGLFELGSVLFNEIGGSMGPIYGTIFMEMSDRAEDAEEITLKLLTDMLKAGLDGLYEILDARPGDKTIVDTMDSAIRGLQEAAEEGKTFSQALDEMKEYAENGKESTKAMVAKYGRASRLGERSRGVLDAGATSCCIILQAMADGIKAQLAADER